MKKLIAVLFAAMFAAVSFQAVAQAKKPTADECKKNPKMAGCEQPAKK
jgi:cytochrome oxidase Cu insertion factor (SCO1/SenC/PrrC family)